MQRGIIDEEELGALADFCFSNIKVKAAMRGGKDTAVIDVEDFSCSFSDQDRCQFGDVVQLFDRQRRTGFLERCFTPKYLRTTLGCQADTVHRAVDQATEKVDETKQKVVSELGRLTGGQNSEQTNQPTSVSADVEPLPPVDKRRTYLLRGSLVQLQTPLWGELGSVVNTFDGGVIAIGFPTIPS